MVVYDSVKELDVRLEDEVEVEVAEMQDARREQDRLRRRLGIMRGKVSERREQRRCCAAGCSLEVAWPNRSGGMDDDFERCRQLV